MKFHEISTPRFEPGEIEIVDFNVTFIEAASESRRHPSSVHNAHLGGASGTQTNVCTGEESTKGADQPSFHHLHSISRLKLTIASQLHDRYFRYITVTSREAPRSEI